MKAKEILRVAVAMVLSAPALCHAQYAHEYYHRIGDTIQWKANNGYYSWWGVENYYNRRHKMEAPYHAHFTPGHREIYGHYFYTADTLKIIGIAVQYSSYGRYYPTSQEYLYVYDAQPGYCNLVELASVPLRLNPDSCRYLSVSAYTADHGDHTTGPDCDYYQISGSRDTCCGGTCTWHLDMPLFEHYFEVPVYVIDSFYIGASDFSSPLYTEGIGDHTPYQYPLYGAFHGTMAMFGGNYSVPCDGDTMYPTMNPAYTSCLFPIFRLIWYQPDPNIQRYGWSYVHAPFMPMYYPIIQVDTTIPPADQCPPVENLQLSLLEEGCATFTWDNFPNYAMFEVRYCTTGDNAAPWNSFYTTDNMFRLCDIDSTSDYLFTVRAICTRSDRTTEWAPDISFTLRPEDTTAIVAPSSGLANNTFITPNPAHDRVTVSSHFGVLGVEVFDARGNLMLKKESYGLDPTIDISALPQGSYIVRIETMSGTTSKVLIKK